MTSKSIRDLGSARVEGAPKFKAGDRVQWWPEYGQVDDEGTLDIGRHVLKSGAIMRLGWSRRTPSAPGTEWGYRVKEDNGPRWHLWESELTLLEAARPGLE